MFKPSFFLLTCCLTSISAFSQRNYEYFSYLGLAGVVNKNTLEIEVEPKYSDASIEADSAITLFNKDGSTLVYNAINKQIKKGNDRNIYRPGGAYNSYYSNNSFCSTKDESYLLMKNDKKNKYLGITIPDSLVLKSDIRSLVLAKNSKPYLDIVYETENNNIQFYLPNELKTKLGIKTYAFDENYVREFYKVLENENEISDFLKESKIPLGLLYLCISNFSKENYEGNSVKNNLISLMVYEDNYESAKKLFRTFYSKNFDELEKDERQILLTKAIQKNDLDFIKSIPKESLKKIIISDEYQDRKNLLYYALITENFKVTKYLVSIGLDVNKVFIYSDGTTESALELLESVSFKENQPEIIKIIKNAPRN
ncbi:ankyrin repeat domain-containing protein [Empedobacter sedimenti]|uniref:hypothetical protein n=1 Tax=Empedobacter sedimenti TaxID=3042610 RepID=UPI0024A697F2|nr:hypothetical protein [Empedobacter sedimenti]